jgi:WhiB family transcriptional regulator, redox-sensing transcriptional regulator
MQPRRPLIPSEALWAWQLDARCRDADPTIFFTIDGERGHAQIRRQRRAKAICAQCGVARECLQYSIRHDERFGIWGGLAEHERARFRRDLAQSSPRFDDEH